MLDWMGCSAAQCPYDKEYADCEYCRFLIRESKNPAKNVDSPKLPVKMTDFSLRAIIRDWIQMRKEQKDMSDN